LQECSFDKRLANHKTEEADANKQSHFTIKMNSDNASRVAATAVLAQCVEREPDTVDENACLLQHPTEGVGDKFMVIVDELLKAEGCCFCHDKVDHEWQRMSGKVSDQGCEEQWFVKFHEQEKVACRESS
jgi:hypothetical protein